MRFHVGFSFRLKHLKKFLFPILIGLLTYFGLNVFTGFTNVYASSTNVDTYYIYDFKDFDFDTLSMKGHPMSYYLHYFDDLNDYYYTIPFFEYNTGSNFYSITYYLTPISAEYINQSFYFKNSSSTSQLLTTMYSSNNVAWKRLKIQSNQTIEVINSTLDTIYSCVTSNSCSGMSSTSVTESLGGIVAYSTKVDNVNNFNANYLNGVDGNLAYIGGFIYSSPIPIYFIQGSDTGSKVFYKSLIWNGQTLVFGDLLPPFYSNNPTPTPIPNLIGSIKNDDIFVSNISTSDLSNFRLDIEFNYSMFDTAIDFSSYQLFFYGRRNNTTYYSYEELSCTKTFGSAIDTEDFYIKTSLYNVSCGDLSNYDQVFVRLRPSVNAMGKAINTLILTTNYGYANVSPIFNGDNSLQIMDYFQNLSSDYNILLSTTDNINYSTYISDNDFTFMSKVDRVGNKISSLTGFQLWTYGSYDNTNLLVYNYTPQNNENTNLFLFFDENTIISKGVNGDFTYYDSTNTLTNGSLQNNYQIIHTGYEMDDIFSQVNNFLLDIDSDLASLHVLVQSAFDSLPLVVQNIINIFYILSLAYLLFKVIRK